MLPFDSHFADYEVQRRLEMAGGRNRLAGGRRSADQISREALRGEGFWKLTHRSIL
jgi:hypothetical protein